MKKSTIKQIVKTMAIAGICTCILWIGCRIELTYGVCVDDAGHGLDDAGYYISYVRYDDAQMGNEYITLCILNPFNTYTDDIIYRADIKCGNAWDIECVDGRYVWIHKYGTSHVVSRFEIF